MAVTFELDISAAARNQLQLQMGFQSIGDKADAMEGKLRGMAADIAKLIQATEKQFKDSGKAYATLQSNAKSHAKVITEAQRSVLAAAQQIIQQHTLLTIKSNAYKGSLKELQAVLKDSAAQESYIKYAKLTANLSTEQIEQNKHLHATIDQLSSAVAQENLQLKETIRALGAASTADLKRKNSIAAVEAELAALGTQEGQLLVRLQDHLNAQKLAVTGSDRYARAIAALETQIAACSTEEGKRELLLKAQLKTEQDAVTAAHRHEQANKALQASIEARGSAESILALKQAASLASNDKLALAAHRQALANKELSQELQLVTSSIGKVNSVLQAKIKLAAQENQEATLTEGKLAKLYREYDSLKTGMLGLVAAQAVRNKGLSDAATFEEREANTLAELKRINDSLTGGLGEQAAILRVLNSAREKEVTELTREQAQVELLTRSLVSLNGGHQQQIVQLTAQIAARKKAILGTEVEIKVTEQVKVTTEALTAALARAAVAKERQKDAISRNNAALLEEARALNRLTQAEAEAIAKTEALVAANKRHSEALMDEARKLHGVSKAQLELVAVEERQREKLENLRAQVSMLSSARGREHAALKKSILEQTAYNKLLVMSTAELLGFTGAQQRANIAMLAGSQTAAMLRAGMAAAGSGIGMYTSATVLAAAATYAVVASLRSAITTGSEFTASMARTNAIMSGGDNPKWLKDDGQMAAMEEKVRALGMSTSFTATQVSDALTQLAMAGLNAGDAMMALKPSLDLALIGNLSMAESADISTNVMMAFGVGTNNATSGVQDLTEVVNIMAAAASNSNTTIQQLASALTYAGPAAATAGISMRDTVAAIETMANSGIKASRSGTALRKMFVSMLNPTEKGSAMMEKYGISVVDAEGRTRGLTDIVGQLSTALKDLTGGERLSAIQDLVGLYATPPVAGLVDNVDKLNHLRAQLNDVSVAAEEMRKRISDAFEFDMKGVTSAFEEVKILAFDSQEWLLRNTAASLTKWMLDLTNTVSSVKVGDKTVDITQLDIILQRSKDVAVGIGYMTAGFLAMRLTSGTVMLGLASDMTAGALRTQMLSVRLQETALSMRQYSAALLQSSVQSRVAAQTATTLAAGLTMLSSAATATAAVLSRVAIVAGGVMRALGWVGLIYGIGSALYSVFGGSSTEDDIANQKLSVDELKSSYEGLREAIAKTAAERERRALQDKKVADVKSVEQLAKRHGELSVAISAAKGVSGTESLVAGFEAEQERIRVAMVSYGMSITSVDEELKKSSATYLSRGDVLDSQIKLVTELGKAQGELNRQIAISSSIGHGNSGFSTEQALSNPLVMAKRATLDALTAQLPKDTKDNPVAQEPPRVPLDQVYAEQVAELQSVERAKELSDAENYLRVTGERVALEAKMARNAELAAAARANNKPAITAEDADFVGRDVAKLDKLISEQNKYKLAVSETAKEHKAAEAALIASTATDTQRLATTSADLQKVVESRRLLSAAVATGDPVAMEKDNVLLKDQNTLTQAQISLQKSLASAKLKADKPQAKTKGDKDIEKDTQAYDALLKKIDPVTYSLEQLTYNTGLLSRMRANGKITEEQEKAALTEMSKLHYELTLKQDLNYQSLKKIQDAYLQSPYAPAIDDLIELNRLQRETNGGVKDYAVLSEAMKKKNNDAATAGLPTAPTRLNDSASSPFGEYVNSELEKQAGKAKFGKRLTDFDTGQVKKEVDINTGAADAIKAEEALQRDHADKLVEIERNKNKAIEASQNQAKDSRAKIEDASRAYDEQSAKMSQIAMLGSLENVMGMMAATGENATTAQKVAFVAQKALAVAQILMYTHVASIGAMANAPGPFGMTMGQLILAQGYASAGLVAGLAVAEVAGGGKSKGKSSGAYDDGGFIPHNSYGIVGEYGPEIVHGPANVTSRKDSAKKLAGGSGETNITLAPVIQVTVDGASGNTGNEEAQGKQIAGVVKAVVMSTLIEQTRPNGALDTWMRNKR
jgi:TP901 family phage tail tape measure protein